MTPRKFLRVAALAAWFCSAASALGQSSAFSYQGRLNAAGTPANGAFDFRLTLFGSATGGTPLAGPVTNLNVSVTNGLFMTSADFGTNAYAGGNRWLEIAVQTNGTAGGFTTLAPRQALAATPVAVFALTGNQGAPGTNGAPGINGAPGTTGQGAVTTLGTNSLSLAFNSPAVLIPGLSASVNVPTNCVVFVTTDGGAATTSSSSSGGSVLDVYLAIDGTPLYLSGGGLASLAMLNNAGISPATARWSLSQAITLTAGAHTIAVYAYGNGTPGSSTAIVSGDSSSVLQGELTVLFLKL